MFYLCLDQPDGQLSVDKYGNPLIILLENWPKVQATLKSFHFDLVLSIPVLLSKHHVKYVEVMFFFLILSNICRRINNWLNAGLNNVEVKRTKCQ